VLEEDVPNNKKNASSEDTQNAQPDINVASSRRDPRDHSN